MNDFVKVFDAIDTGVLVLLVALFSAAALLRHTRLDAASLVPALLLWLFLGWLALHRAQADRQRAQQLEQLLTQELPDLRQTLEEIQTHMFRSQLQGALLAVDMLCSDPCIQLSPDQKTQIREWSRQFREEDPSHWN